MTANLCTVHTYIASVTIHTTTQVEYTLLYTILYTKLYATEHGIWYTACILQYKGWDYVCTVCTYVRMYLPCVYVCVCMYVCACACVCVCVI